MSTFDTLEDAAANYHLEWSPFLAELQLAIESDWKSSEANLI